MTAVEEYRKVQVNTADRVRIVSLLFDGAVNFLKMGREAMERGDIASKGLYLGKATAIIGELSSSLDMNAGGEISPNLKRLYDFVLDRIFHANMRNDSDAVDVAIRVIDMIRDGWKEIEKVQSGGSRIAENREEMGVRA